MSLHGQTDGTPRRFAALLRKATPDSATPDTFAEMKREILAAYEQDIKDAEARGVKRAASFIASPNGRTKLAIVQRTVCDTCKTIVDEDDLTTCAPRKAQLISRSSREDEPHETK